MKIRTKLIISSAIMIALLLILAGVAINNIFKLSGQMNEMYQERYKKMELAYEGRGHINELAKEIARLMLDPTLENVNRLMPALEARYEAAAASFDELGSMVQASNVQVSAAEQQILSQVDTARSQFSRYAVDLLTVIENGSVEEAQALYITQGGNVEGELINKTNELATYHSRLMDGAFTEATSSNERTLTVMIAVAVMGLLIGIVTMLWNMRLVGRGLASLSAMIRGFAQGTVDASSRVENLSDDEFGDVGRVFNTLAENLEQKSEYELRYNKQMEDDSWIKTHLTQTVMAIQSQTDLARMSKSFIQELTPLLGASYGALYIREGNGTQQALRLQGSYAFHDEKAWHSTFLYGQGLVGQCAEDRKVIELHELPSDYVKVKSGTGETEASYLVLHPIQYQDELLGVLEIASLRPLSPVEKQLLEETVESLGIILNSLFGRIRVEELLRESQTLSEELQAQSEELLSQQEELRSSNERLEDQTRQLKKSEELLQSQQEELEQSNEELLQKTHLLELQMKRTEEKHEQVEKTRQTLEKQTVQLALSSKYKSEFLTNMSHELRTPLNSLLILSQMLMDNKEGNLTSKQLEFAGTIYASGNDLLKLIDEILDLSKISAGKMDVVIEHLPITELDLYLRRSFTQMGLQKGVLFETHLDAELPEQIYTDSHRVKQILKNLLSNAFKFTQQGSVELTIRPASQEETDNHEGKMIAFEVKDTGIGIPEDKQQLIFEAFQQVDGTTSRIYGGTGLGLAISRELAGLLGGTISLHSKEGEGSTFTLYLPEFLVASEAGSELHDSVLTSTALADTISDSVADSAAQAAPAKENRSYEGVRLPNAKIDDDADNLQEGDKVVLIVEDDIHFARVLLDIARTRGFKGIVAMQGDKGLSYARTYKPDAILLDIQLPVLDGWAVLNQLKHHAETRHIPVHVISVVDDIQHGLAMGAIAYLKKPASKEHLDQVFSQIEGFMERDLKRLLVVEDDLAQRNSIVELIGHDDVLITAVSTGREALTELKGAHYDCMVLDLGLPDISGFELLDAIRKEEGLSDLPVIVYTGRELDKKEELRLKRYAGTIIVKDVKSPERLLDETTLFLHRVEADMPEDKRNMLRKLHNIESIFEGRNILIVDDDVRNVFALSSVLENYRMNISFAENGVEALQQLEKQGDFDLVLMDIMMPEMDGYEAMREIRSMPKYDKLPIIAITAKAMKDDRDKCIEAGASDYIAKPVNTEQLLSLMRVWLYK
ncbi:response regulator [Paenibacillus daejeonensis]|uniref:response regulator n=1 Tax=Paenibacillus daejeonensis TaxID=135193 RepID=UPI00036FB63E|nr:response regulator [Paenibacillus daejeonensis]